MYVYDIRAMLQFLSGFYAIARASTRFCPETSYYISQPVRLKWIEPFRENEPARQVTYFQPASYNRNFIVGQISVIAELYLKKDTL